MAGSLHFSDVRIAFRNRPTSFGMLGYGIMYEREFGIRMTTSMRPQIDINHRAIRKGSPDDFIGTVYCQRTSCPSDSGTS